MAALPNPYQSPSEDELDENGNTFPHWTTFKMVVLFFLPSLALLIAAIGITRMIPALTIGGFIACPCAALTVIIFSALVHQRRQEAGRGTFWLMALVYLLAQIFALFLTIATLSVIFGALGLRLH